MVYMNPAMPKKDYQALIFDCDGTLTDSMPVHYVAWHRTMTGYGIRFPEDRFYALGGMPSDKIVGLLAGEQGILVNATQVAMEKEHAFLHLLHLLEPIVPVLAVAEHFRFKLPMVVASGGIRDVIQRQLLQIGCENWFDALVTAEDTARHKPEPDVFLEAARRVGAAPQRCLVYEDSDLGITAAQAAGMDYVDVRTFFSPKRIAV